MALLLGVEIGGTKLQLGVGRGDGGQLTELVRDEVDPALGAAGILGQIERIAPPLIESHDTRCIGIGFGGPVDAKAGRTILSNQIEGWKDVPLVEWARKTLRRPTVLGNDCDLASLAEARFGAGKGRERVFYVTVGTGVGGGWVVRGRLDGADRPAIAEIGHLRPGLQADLPDATVESMASGWGIAAGAAARIREGGLSPKQTGVDREKGVGAEDVFVADLLERCRDNVDALSAEMVGQAAAAGNAIATEAIDGACRALGWAIAQAITLLAPQVIVIGGGVSLMGRHLFLDPVRREVARYVFPPLLGSYEIVPARLGELVVVQGALAIARDA